MTTDNAGNYVKAVESHMKRVNIPCLTHMLNLAVCKGLCGVRAIETGISKLKMITAHFSKSAVDSYLLEKKQKLLQVKSDKLINDCPTRWDSTYDMIARALEQQAMSEEHRKQVREKVLSELTTGCKEKDCAVCHGQPVRRRIQSDPEQCRRRHHGFGSMRWICMNEKLRYPLTKTLLVGGKNRAPCIHILRSWQRHT